MHSLLINNEGVYRFLLEIYVNGVSESWKTGGYHLSKKKKRERNKRTLVVREVLSFLSPFLVKEIPFEGGSECPTPVNLSLTKPKQKTKQTKKRTKQKTIPVPLRLSKVLLKTLVTTRHIYFGTPLFVEMSDLEILL